MPQFYVPSKNLKNKSFYFEPSESHHIAKVLRKKEGEILQIFDGEGRTLTAKLTHCSNPNQIIGEIIESQVSLHTESHRLKIYPALIKLIRFEWMLEKVTELGVHAIQPMITERTVMVIRNEKLEQKLKRWEKILISSAKQCGNPNIPEISAPIPLKEAIRTVPEKDLKLILWEGELKQELSQIIPTKSPDRTSHLLIGPEGGFSIPEFNLAKDHGFIPVRLGNTILRAETAVLAASSLILF